MKEPNCLVDDEDYGGDECVRCGETWPCKKWKRWTSSKDYRIKLLEERVTSLYSERERHSKDLVNARSRLFVVETILKGQAPAMGDLLRTIGGSLDWETVVDYEDFTSLCGPPARMARNQTFTVTYKDGDGSVWKNGVLVEKVYGHP